MSKTFRTACIQNTATRDINANINWVCNRIDEAYAAGAEFITMPESVGLIEQVNGTISAQCFTEQRDVGLIAFQNKAKQLKVTILVSQQLIKLDDHRIVNRSILVSDQGEITARYDKLHMFDIEQANGESYLESGVNSAGNKVVLATTLWGELGMSICYDLRFAALYRTLAQNGAQFITIPAAFTQTTGKVHWHTLVQAREIETGCYVIAPNQCGHHADKRYSQGHSLIVNPWRDILADGGAEPGIIYANIDLAEVDSARSKIPALKNDREFVLERF